MLAKRHSILICFIAALLFFGRDTTDAATDLEKNIDASAIAASGLESFQTERRTANNMIRVAVQGLEGSVEAWAQAGAAAPVPGREKFSTPAVASGDRAAPGLKGVGVVDIKKLIQSLDLKTFSKHKKTPATERLLREKLTEAGWSPNDEGVFLLRLSSSELSYLSASELRSLYILPLTRAVLPVAGVSSEDAPYYVVVREELSMDPFSTKMRGFGYIGRGSHTKGERYGILPFNKGFVALLSQFGGIANYVFTLDDVDTEQAKGQRSFYELYLKCRFSSTAHNFMRTQANIKHSRLNSPHSRRIMEYLLCVDVVGAFLYNKHSATVIREWRID